MYIGIQIKFIAKAGSRFYILVAPMEGLRGEERRMRFKAFLLGEERTRDDKLWNSPLFVTRKKA